MPSDAGQNPLDPSQKITEFNPRLTDTVEMDALLSPPKKPAVPKLVDASQARLSNGEAVWISVKSPAKPTENEDSVAAFSIGTQRGLLVVADGLGGHRGGRTASQSVIRGLQKTFVNSEDFHEQTEITISGGLKVPVGEPTALTDTDYRSMLLDQIETTNRRLINGRTGAATTLALVEIAGNRARTYHVGDSPILVISQRGQIKHETIAHSPVGYAVEAGLLSEKEAIEHEDRHLVSNVVGARDMSVELGPWVNLAARDTVLLASDGLFDNLLSVEIVDRIRSGSLRKGVLALANLAIERMSDPQPKLPSKPDDLTILAYRRLPPRKLNRLEE